MSTIKAKLPNVYRLSLWQKWILACTLGELIGMAAVALIAVILHQTMGTPETLAEKLIQLLVMMTAGMIEGFFLGYFQWNVIKKRFPFLPSRKWIGYTVLAGLIGWFLGMSATLLFTPPASFDAANNPMTSNWFTPFVIPAIMGMSLGTFFGFFQWLPLRHYATHAHRWIWANALGWTPAMIWIFLIASLPSIDTPLWAIIMLGILAGILAGASLGIITGYYFQKLNLKSTLESETNP